MFGGTLIELFCGRDGKRQEEEGSNSVRIEMTEREAFIGIWR
jgi:hypothetical protein